MENNNQTNILSVATGSHSACMFGLLLSVMMFPATGISALYGDSKWLVEKGDSVYSIARKVFPDDAAKQRQFRQELVSSNPDVFHGNANQMSLGAHLVLPGFAVSQPVKEVAPIAVQPVVEPEPVQPVVAEVVEEKVVTVDPEDVIGRVVISRGNMQASNRGVFRDLLRHSEVMKGDTLITSARTYTQIRMKDGALISLRPNTELIVTDYNYNGKEDGSERGFFELVRGGFRTITGYIGHRNKHNYQVKTSVATIGIRGTHYGLMVCADGSCNEESPDLEDGVYGGVVDGSIIVNNDAGETVFNNDQYFHVASQNFAAVEQLVPPPIFHGKAEQRAAIGSGNQANKISIKDDNVSKKTVKGSALGSLVYDLVTNPNLPRSPLSIDQRKNKIKDFIATTNEVSNSNLPAGITGQIAPDGAGLLIAFTDVDSGSAGSGAASIIADAASNNGVAFGAKTNAAGVTINKIPLIVNEASNGTTHRLFLPSGVNGVSDIGGDLVGVNWGRWSDTYVLTEDGQPVTTIGDLHYIYSDNITSTAQLASLGGLGSSVVYSFVGGTTPSSATGQVGTVSALNVTADFMVSKNINYQLTGSNNGQAFVLGATVGFGQMSEFSLTDIGCSNSCDGRASAVFVGNNAEGIITTYSVQELSGANGLQGAALLKR